MKSLRYILILSSVLLFLSCWSNRIEDRYKPFPGTVIITEINNSVYNPNGKNMYCDVFMDFTPDDIDAVNRYRYRSWPDRHIQFSHKSRMNIYKPLLKKLNIEIGNRYRAIRYEKSSSFGGSPVVFQVDLKNTIE